MKILMQPFAITGLLVFLISLFSGLADEPKAAPGGFRVPEGWAVDLVADESLVRYPQFACLDDKGRLYVAEGTGKNLPGSDIEPLKIAKISLLEDTDGDGKFDTRKVFADGLVFGSGVLWHDGSVYVASHPAIWKLTDTNGDDVADKREELVGKFGFTGNGCDIHGPFFFPDGWLYWTMGRHGYRVDTPEGEHLEGLAARVWRCRPDGTGIERIAGGGFDNTVELVFTETADLCGTMDQYPGDMLLQYVNGGVYPRGDQPSLAEFPRTGPLMTPITGFSAAYPAALCGLVRLRSDHFGPGHRGTLLTTQFNVRRLQRHIIKHEGAKLVSENTDFLVSTDWDFHPTDVLEDADGSLLIVDTGSWFNYQCPTQKIAKEKVTGVVYRVRHLAAEKHDDPWGKKIEWASLPVAKLTALLGDVRHQVGMRSVEELVKRGGESVAALTKLLNGEAASLTRREAVYALSRIGTTEARSAVRAALDCDDAGVREVAAHCVSVERDAEALPALTRMVVNDTPANRRKAAEALGRIGKAEAVKPLLQSISKGAGDGFLKHSLIYALIEIGAFEATLPALGDSSPAVRRAALIALDQMNGTELSAPNPSNRGHALLNPHRGNTFHYIANGALLHEHIAPLLDAADPALQLAVMETISHRPAWSEELLTVAARWVRQPKLDEVQREALVTALLGAAGENAVQKFVADSLLNAKIPTDTRREIFSVLARSRVKPQPQVWLDTLEKILHGNNLTMQREVLKIVSIRGITQFDKILTELAGDSATSAEVRFAATAILAPRTILDTAAFDLLSSQLTAAGNPLLPVTAATALGSAKLSAAQRESLVGKIAEAGPLTLPLLVKAFYNTRNRKAGMELAKALIASPGARALPEDELEQIYGIHVFQREDDDIAITLKPLIDQHKQTHAKQAQYLAELGDKMSTGAADVENGKKVFFSKESMCSVCHKVNGVGGHLGPDLSRIGAIRTTRALLEAIVFPSSTIVPDFRAYSINLKNGEIAYGAIARESSDAVFLRTTTLEETRIVRSDIKSIEPSVISFMPQGLEKTMMPKQLNDLLEYLYTLK